jgi:hypothetical protein
MKTKTGRQMYLRFRLVGWLFSLMLTVGHWVSSANAQATNAQMLGKVVDQTGAVGSAWEFLRNDDLNARNWFAPAPAAKPILKQNQFGVAGGGPILKDKAFFFATYEGLRIHQVTLENLADNTPAERAGTFPGTAANPLRDPFTNSPYPYNSTTGTYQIPQSE